MSESEETSFVRGLQANPSDAVFHLVYADWLEERGDPRSEPLRLVSNSRGALYFCVSKSNERFGRVRSQYQRSLASIQRLQQLVPTLQMGTVPTFEQVMKSFSAEQWEAVEQLREPALILIPPVDFQAYVEAFNRHPNTSKEYRTYVNNLYTQHTQSPTTRWQAFFVEGEQNMPARSDDVLDQTLAERITQERTARPKTVTSIDRRIYAQLMSQSLDAGTPIDTNTWTLLDGDPIYTATNGSRVPAAGFAPGPRRVDFFWFRAGGVRRPARFRRAVGGDVAQE